MNLQERKWTSFISSSVICVVYIPAAGITSTATKKRLSFRLEI
jgi:hypothetical protein